MPTEFDWKTWKKKQNEPEPPPPPPEPKLHGYIEGLANALLFAVLIGSLLFVWSSSVESDYLLKVIDHCNSQKGVAVKTIRGDVICIREDSLTEVLGKSTDHIK